MKIAVNARFLLKDRLEGIGWFSYEVLHRLVQQHPEHEFLFFFDRPYDESFVFGPNVKPIVLFPPARHVTLWWYWFEWSLPQALKKYKAELFFSPDNFMPLRYSINTILICHDIAYEHLPKQVPWHVLKYYQYFFPKFLHKAEHIITVSEFTKKDIIQQYQISSPKIRVGCNGCRTTFVPLSMEQKAKVRAKYSEGQPYFFYLGAVHPRKNVHRLIQAFTRFKEKTNAPHQLLIGGRLAWQTTAVKTALEETSVSADIKLLGYIADEELPQLMGAAFALSYVSLFEGFGVPLLEAMHCEIPIIGSNTSSIPEVIGPAGLIVDPRNLEEISAAMTQLYQNPTLQQELIEKGKVQRALFSWQKVVDIISELIEN